MYIDRQSWNKDNKYATPFIRSNTHSKTLRGSILDTDLSLFNFNVNKYIASNGKERYSIAVSNGSIYDDATVTADCTKEDFTQLLESINVLLKQPYRISTKDHDKTNIREMTQVSPEVLFNDAGIIKEEYRIQEEK